jgi:putative hydrolase of the HAD superfamily
MKDLKKKLLNYNIIIFDLDDTIYSQKDYDNPALLQVSKYLTKIIKKDKNIIFKKLRSLKKIRRGLAPKPVFDIFLKDYKNINKKKIISSCISLFQKYECKELKNSKSLKILLKDMYKQKTLFIVTNGPKVRQENKIKYLKIKGYFKKIFILDGVKKEIKPSITNVKYLVRYLKKNKNLKSVFVGDNKVSDYRFAKNLKIEFVYYQFPIVKKINNYV